MGPFVLCFFKIPNSYSVVMIVIDRASRNRKIDFAKAFEKVPHRRLLHKLEYYGIRGSTHKWINSWLSGRTQQVVLDGQASDPVPVLSCVPQGSVLGPVLFLIFINDLPDNIRSSVRLFTDDCVLYRNIHSRQDCLTLQEDLTSLGQWKANWQIKFNVAKCHSMRVTRHQHHKQILFYYSLRSLDISAHNNFGPCQFRPITKSAYTISAHGCNQVQLVCLSIIGIIMVAYL